jgi:hypothetical protein
MYHALLFYWENGTRQSEKKLNQEDKTLRGEILVSMSGNKQTETATYVRPSQTCAQLE